MRPANKTPHTHLNSQLRLHVRFGPFRELFPASIREASGNQAGARAPTRAQRKHSRTFDRRECSALKTSPAPLSTNSTEKAPEKLGGAGSVFVWKNHSRCRPVGISSKEWMRDFAVHFLDHRTEDHIEVWSLTSRASCIKMARRSGHMRAFCAA